MGWITVSKEDKVLDLTLLKLKKRIERVTSEGNLVEAHALEILIEGYLDNIWTVYWDRGEPVFAMNTTPPEEILRDLRKKYNKIN